MTSPRSTYIPAQGFEIHVSEWGDPAKPALVMWHGLARTGRDFDEAAEALSDSYFVLCPDTLGRGMSSWAMKPEVDYSQRVYGEIAVAILDRYAIEKLRWVGTSMGGMIGIRLAANALKDRISHLVINDVGPDIPQAGTSRIAGYLGNPPVLDTLTELEAWLRTTYAPFGENSASFWRRIADTSARRTDKGKVTLHYDPAIATQFTHHQADLDLWGVYEAISAKTLLIRGAASDVLSQAVAEKMLARGPKPRFVEISGCGHAPTLANAEQIGVLREFLAG
jgi:pimeloyl-ACP methyl ester carboxylesterase